MQTIETLRDEHEGVLAVLGQLERAVGAAERGAPVPSDVFADIQEFFAVFVDRCHHSKEESELFPRLVAGGSSDIVHRLESEHVTGRSLAKDYADAVGAYRPGDAASGGRLAAAARAYADLLRRHIDLETQELFPATEALAADDHAIAEGFERIEEERIGPGTHERLHGMIAGLGGRIDPWIEDRRGS
jgi:hemerythrin-like domain-containing protein